MMIKKYLPFFILIAAAFLLFFIKKNQRGNMLQKYSTGQAENRITMSASLPSKEKGNDEQGIKRNANNIIFSKHAKCRMDCRKIGELEVKEILKNGILNSKKIQSNKRGKTYIIEGYTYDKQLVRIVFAPKGNHSLVVVTVIDLETEWACDCK